MSYQSLRSGFFETMYTIYSPFGSNQNMRTVVGRSASGNALASINVVCCATSDPVSTKMGDSLWTGKPFRPNQPTRSTQPSIPPVGR